MTSDMSRLSAIAVIAAAGFAFAVPAHAQDANDTADWEGLYIGAHVGGTFADDEAVTSTSFCGGFAGSVVGNAFTSTNGCYFAQSSVDLVNASGSGDVGSDRFNAGLQAGYNFQHDSFVAGIEVDLALDRRNEAVANRGTYTNVTPPFDFEVRQSVDTDWMATARARAGFTSGRALLYATGGLAVTRVDYRLNFEDFPATPPVGFVVPKALASNEVRKTLVGWTAGAGAEFRINDRWSVTGMYLYTEFNTSDTSNTLAMSTLNASGGVNGAPVALSNQTFSSRVSLKSHGLRIGFNYRF